MAHDKMHVIQLYEDLETAENEVELLTIYVDSLKQKISEIEQDVEEGG